MPEKNQAAANLGKLGGSSRTDAKVAAAKANGAKGGRPLRIQFTTEQRLVLIEVLKKDLVRLTRFRDDDPLWSDRLWQKSIDECSALTAKLEPDSIHVDLKKTDAIHLVQLLAQKIAAEEKAGNKTYANKALDKLLTNYHAVAEYLDTFITAPDQTSILQHYLKEARGRL